MPLTSLEDLYVDELKDLYSAETQITKALPRMAKKAETPELRAAFEEHLEVTRGHVQRLEQIFEELGKTPRGKKCVGMEGLLKEGQELMQEDAEPMVMDAGLISGAQRVEHYEMAAYGTVRTFAETLGYDQAARLLQQTLDEEGEADKKLTALAENNINQQALDEGDMEEGEEPRRRAA